MKKPDLSNLADVKPSDNFLQKAQQAKTEGAKITPRSYSLSVQDVDYINAKAAALAAEAGKPVSASTALRTLLEEHRSMKGA